MRLFIVTIFGLMSIHASVNGQNSKISDDLLAQFEHADVVDCIIRMEEQLDLLKATKGLSKNEKAEMVYASLKDHAKINQKSVRRFLKDEHIEFQSYFIFNGFRAQLTLEQAHHITQEFAVEHIHYNEPIRLNEVQKNKIDLRTDAEWGVHQIGADSVWALGYEGTGVIIGGQDTGYDFDNPLILNKYRGYSLDTVIHDYNWHDAISAINPLHGDTVISESLNPCGFLSPIPCDDNGHGTHTMGTMVGQDEDNFIGVAPKAKWIACRNMERGFGTPASYTECFEWFLAPTDLNGQNPDPTKAPHVINNSWGCPDFEGCNPDNWSIMEMAVNNLTAAGTVVVVSAGNNGSQNCGSVSTVSAIFEQSFTVGATDIQDSIGSFSSVGPVSIDGSFRFKPDVVAPGVGVRSITLNEQFGTWNGTSMASPHVAGAVALLINANPALSGDVDRIKQILKSTAVPLVLDQECNGLSALEVPNFVFGSGRIDIFEAVKQALVLTATEDIGRVDRDVLVLPNPSAGTFTLQSSSALSLKDILIYNAYGHIMKKIDGNDYKVSFDLSEHPSGVYFYRLSHNGVIKSGTLLLHKN